MSTTPGTGTAVTRESCVVSYTAACSSTANACGRTSTGTIQCDGTCSVAAPANPVGYGTACTSVANACGQTNTGTRDCLNNCTASAPPVVGRSVVGVDCALWDDPETNTCYGGTTDEFFCSNGGLYYPNNGCHQIACATSGTWVYPSECSTTCSSLQSTQVQVCAGGNGYCPGSPTTRVCSATPACVATVYYTITASAGAGGFISPPGVTTVLGGHPAAPAGLVWVLYNSVQGNYDSPGNIVDPSGPPATPPASLSSTYTDYYCVDQGGGDCYEYFDYYKAVTGAAQPAVLGGSQTYTITPNAGFTIGSVVVDDKNQGTASSYPFTNVSANHIITATFNSAAMNGSCSATHYSCTAGLSTNNVDGANAYTWSCAGSNGGTTASCSETKVVAQLSTAPAIIDAGQSTRLKWSSNAASCTGTGFNTGGAAANNVGVPVNPSVTSTYQINCGSAWSQATVTVNQPQIISFTATPTRVHPGDTSVIAWNATQVTSCAISGPHLATTGTSGSSSVTITSQSTYTITCQTNDPTAPISETTTVNVVPSYQAF